MNLFPTGRNEGNKHVTTSDSFLKLFYHKLFSFHSLFFCWLFVLRSINDFNNEDPFSQALLWSWSTWCSLRGLITALWSCHADCHRQKGEMAPDKLITSHVFFRKESPGLLRPLLLAFTKGHLVSVQDLFENCSNHQEGQGQYFSKTKSIMTYFTVGLTFCQGFFCLLLGVSLIPRNGCKALYCLS